MLELYQFEDCPFCARVRDELDRLGLDYVVRSVPRPHALRERVKAVSGQTQVPVLVDPGRNKVVIESEDIIEYLDNHYGRKET